MKVTGSFALCAAAVVAISASAASAFALGGLFDNGLSQKIATASRVNDDDSFFPGQELTMGKLEATSNYAKSAIDASYSECASCAGDAPVAAPVVYGAGIPAAVVYDGFVPYAPVVSYGYGFEYGYEVARGPVRGVARFVERVRPVRRVLNGVRNLFCGNSTYCRPAYVCDPCWSCCDVCDPCWSCADVCDPCADVCDPCAVPCVAPCDPCAPCGIPAAIVPTSVFAPSSCCGYGYYPGEINELNPETGLPKENNGVPASIDSESTPKETPSLSKRITTEPAQNSDSPALPQYDSSKGLDASSGAEEEIPAPAPTPVNNSGVIRMLVPEDAVVYVNGYRTKQTGALRSFAARQLELGETYSFEIRVVAVREGRVYEDVQTTTLTAGDSTSLAFNLKLNDSEVYAVNGAF